MIEVRRSQDDVQNNLLPLRSCEPSH
jgi:hypothetical protein